MVYDDSLIPSIDDISKMATEYAEKIEKKEHESLKGVCSILMLNQQKLKFFYEDLKKVAKPNAEKFTDKLYNEVLKDIDGINSVIDLSNNEKPKKVNMKNYVDIFKQVLIYEILSLKYCILCEKQCKNTKNIDFFAKLTKISEEHISSLIDCL